MTSLPDAGAEPDGGGWRDELGGLDLAVYAAIAATPSPGLDRFFRRLSRAADHSKLWLGSAAMMAAVGGERGRRAAGNGLASIAVTSAIVNLVLKPVSGRRRPDRPTYDVPVTRQVTMPRSTSFPSGHSASAFAFASGVAIGSPELGLLLNPVATLVAYSRVHTGVHYPGDVIAGAATGATLAPLTVSALKRRRTRRPSS